MAKNLQKKYFCDAEKIKQKFDQKNFEKFKFKKNRKNFVPRKNLF